MPDHPAPSLGGSLLDKSPAHSAALSPEVTLANVFVPLESIKPSKYTPQIYISVILTPINIIFILCFCNLVILGWRIPFAYYFPSPSPGSLLPITVFDGHSLRVLFHFARDSPPSRPDVLVVIISMLSSAPVPATNIHFEAKAPQVSGY